MTISLDVLEQLIAFESVAGRSNLEIIAYIEDFLTCRQFRVHRVMDPVEEKAGLYAEIGPCVDGGVLLSAHCDVVPVTGQTWTKPPFQLTQDGGFLFGRGTTDMKGFLAEMLAVADAASHIAQHTAQSLKEPLKLLISYDEEIGCVGIARMQDRLKPLLGRPRYAIVGEPTEMQVAIGHKGKRSYAAQVTGQTGHSALAPNFVSALQVAVDFVVQLRGLQDDLIQNGARDTGYDIPFSTIHVGKMNSGTALNIVPGSADVLLEFRHLATDDPDHLEDMIRAAAKRATDAYRGASAITLDRQASYPGLATPPHDPAVKAVLNMVGGQTCKVAFGTEAGFFDQLGIPTVVCGPGSMSDQGHKADECISRDQLHQCAQMLLSVLASLQ